MSFTIFAADNGNGNLELWKTDGESGRTSMVKEIRAGSTGSFPGNTTASTSRPIPFAVLGNFAYFAADDGTGSELWKTDGTTAGTTKVSSGAASPQNIVVANGKVFFIGPAAGSPFGIGLFVTDGSSAPTKLNDVGSLSTEMVSNGSRIYYRAEFNLSGLWTSDGTGAATAIGGALANTTGLVDVGGGTVYHITTGGMQKVTGTTATTLTGTGGAAAGSLTKVGNTVFFTNGNNPNVLYSTDVTGTAITTVKTGLNLWNDSQSPVSMAQVGSLLVFANKGATGNELWVSDGTNGGTVLLKDIITGTTQGQQNSSNPRNFATVGGFAYFEATDASGGTDLWRTDGTNAGTTLVKHLLSASMGQNGQMPTAHLEQMQAQDGLLYFTFDDIVHGRELWRSDGTALGTFMVKDTNLLNVNSGYAGPQNPQFGSVQLGANILFTGFNINTGYELWSLNGTTPTLLKDINTGAVSSMPQWYTAIGSKALFTAFDPAHGNELWATDGTAAGTSLLKEFNPGTPGSFLFITVLNGVGYFAADDGSGVGAELWKTDGTLAGTVLIKDLQVGATGSNPGNFVLSNGLVYFTANTAANGTELWVTDGVVNGAGTHITKDINSGAGDANIFSIVPFANKVFFSAITTGSGAELWVSDGSNGGTVEFANINVTAGQGSNPNQLTVFGSRLLFTAADDGFTNTIWTTDGVSAPTKLVNIANHQPQNLTKAGTNFFWSGSDFTSHTGNELYVTTNGTSFTVIDRIGGADLGLNPQSLFAFGNKVLFVAQDTPANASELWVSDGTVGGTQMVQNINATGNNGGNSSPSNFVLAGSQVFFTANDGVNGVELWVTDGVIGGLGTHIVKNIGPGSTNGGVSIFKAYGNRVLFQADDGTNGSELWISDGTNAGTVRLTDVVQLGTGMGSLSGIGSNITTVPLANNTAGSESLTGNSSDDAMIGGGGNDTINGAGGTDAAIYSGNRSQYRILNTASGLKIADLRGGTPDGTDTVTNTEVFVFGTNQSLVLGSKLGPQSLQNFNPAGLVNLSDFNSDLLFQQNGGSVALWTMNGSVIANSFGIGNAGADWHVRASGDFDGDGDSDLIWQQDTGSIVVWTMNGTAMGSSAFVANPGVTNHIKDTADFNNDGKADVLLQADNGTVSIWNMNGAVASGVVVGNAGADWKAIAAGDFNGDGKADILWQQDTGSVVVWLMNGAGVMTQSVFLANPTAAWHVKDAFDFNNDGQADIVLQHDNGLVAVWTVNNMVATGVVAGPNPGTTWHVKGAGDFNHDGLGDISFQNDNGNVVIWNTDGANVTLGTVVLNPGADWHMI